ncbi:hypothetical protein JCM19237_4126 [Photobacterium aphoticum]|uniref:Uncharacterized protein n=1 Tax=Photobacterium aphoticum TaxID=754436 RepID=A0A090QNL0_9GAMM|nr:hypothetical protein JCM19237_4126 [Photobacterium aphoticum]
MVETEMDVVLLILVLLGFTVLSIKLAAHFLDVDSPGVVRCVFATVLAVIISSVLSVLIGTGGPSMVVSFFVTAVMYTLVFSVNTIVGFVLAAVATGIQVAFFFVALALGLSVVGLNLT